MISCTEFVPLYSDFFTHLDNYGGHAAVEKYWEYVSEHRLGDRNNPLSLVSYLEREEIPFVGAGKYWGRTLKEEKTDKEGTGSKDPNLRFSYSHMRRCPSKGKLLDVSDKITPYYDYCGHCAAIFTPVLARYGLTYEMDISECDKAQCYSLLYETGNRPDDSLLVINDKTRTSEMRAEDNEYYHPGFHISCDIALRYCGELFGDDEVASFLAKHTRGYYASRIADARERGIDAIEAWLVEYYKIEKAPERLHITKEGGVLTVTVDSDPAIDFMREMHHTPCKHHSLRTSVPLGTVCADAGLEFEMEYYDENGGTRFFVRGK